MALINEQIVRLSGENPVNSKNNKNIRAKKSPDKSLSLKIIRGQSPDNYPDLDIVRDEESLGVSKSLDSEPVAAQRFLGKPHEPCPP